MSVDGGGTGVTGGGSGTDDGGLTGGGSGNDDGGAVTGGGTTTGGGTGDAGATCLPNHDGTIERSEVFFQPGLRATFKISGAATFDTRGTDGGYWDFTGALAGDSSKLVETKPLTGEWYESEFPDGGYVTELSSTSDLLGVFAATEDALYLQGVVSPTNSGFFTELHYSPWVKVLQFPMAAGAQWQTNADVSGWYNGTLVSWVQSETYAMQVDRAGLAATPFAEFDVLRVRTVMKRSVNFVQTLETHSFNWNTECFGTVATVSSTDNESSAEFTSASEVRRLSN